MTLNRIAKALALLALTSASGVASAVANDTQNIAVSGNVLSVCRFSIAGAQTMDFGDLDPSAAADVTRTATVSYRCTNKATAPTLTVGGNTSGGVDLNMATGGVNLPYRVTWTAPVTAPTGFSAAATAVVLTGKVLAASYKDIQAGLYQHTLVVDITP